MGYFHYTDIKPTKEIMHWDHNERFSDPISNSPRHKSPSLPLSCDNMPASMMFQTDAPSGSFISPSNPFAGKTISTLVSSNNNNINNNNNNNHKIKSCSSFCSQQTSSSPLHHNSLASLTYQSLTNSMSDFNISCNKQQLCDTIAEKNHPSTSTIANFTLPCSGKPMALATSLSKNTLPLPSKSTCLETNLQSLSERTNSSPTSINMECTQSLIVRKATPPPLAPTTQPSESSLSNDRSFSQFNINESLKNNNPISQTEYFNQNPLLDSTAKIICAGCDTQVFDRYYLDALNQKWHTFCLQCRHCQKSLSDQNYCFMRSGYIYCEKDYKNLKKCRRCQLEIPATELVMKAREFVFHIRCFTCSVCKSPLKAGDQIGVHDGAVICCLHYEMKNTELYKMSTNETYNCSSNYSSPAFAQHNVPLMPLPNEPNSSRSSTNMSITLNNNEDVTLKKFDFFNGNSTLDSFPSGSPQSASSSATPRQKGRPRKRKPKDLDSLNSNIDTNSDYLEMGPFRRSPLDDSCDNSLPGMSSSSSRAKRIRTSFKHHQLRTMKSYFAVNHNPDAKDLKQLAQKTGLQKRCLQVWFQNARAKWRRMTNKMDSKSPLNMSEKCSGPSSDNNSIPDLDMYQSNSSLASASLQSLSQNSPQFYN